MPRRLLRRNGMALIFLLVFIFLNQKKRQRLQDLYTLHNNIHGAEINALARDGTSTKTFYFDENMKQISAPGSSVAATPAGKTVGLDLLMLLQIFLVTVPGISRDGRFSRQTAVTTKFARRLERLYNQRSQHRRIRLLHLLRNVHQDIF